MSKEERRLNGITGDIPLDEAGGVAVIIATFFFFLLLGVAAGDLGLSAGEDERTGEEVQISEGELKGEAAYKTTGEAGRDTRGEEDIKTYAGEPSSAKSFFFRSYYRISAARYSSTVDFGREVLEYGSEVDGSTGVIKRVALSRAINEISRATNKGG
ncbi:hypothetical protein QBC39DRAFT_325825 [Podospora conica]|nr:hypothetical protein QBC39DRAFT_325825 [Schizothecium conicum]